MKAFQAYIVAVLASLAHAADVSLTESSDTLTQIELDIVTDVFSDTKKYPATKVKDLQPAEHKLVAQARIQTDDDGDNHLVLHMKHTWDLEWLPSKSSSKQPDYAGLSWYILDASSAPFDDFADSIQIDENQQREVAIQGVLQDAKNKVLTTQPLEQALADFSAGPNYINQGTGYLGPAMNETVAPVEVWKTDSASLQEVEVSGKLYAKGMTLTTDRPFNSESSILQIVNNEDYLLCVDSWIYNGKDVARTYTGCGKFSIDMPEVDNGNTDGGPDNGNGGDVEQPDGDNNGNQIDGEIKDGDGNGQKPDKDGGKNKDKASESGASALALSTAVLALSVLTF